MILPSSIPVTGSLNISIGGHYWICPGGYLSSNGISNINAKLEKGSSFDCVGGTYNTIHVKDSATLNISGTGYSITVYYEPNSIINNTLIGGSNNFIACYPMTFNYSCVSNPGCIIDECNPSIPSNAVIILDSTYAGGAGGLIRWVCPGGHLITNGGGGQLIFLEPGAIYDCMQTGGSTIYVKNNATLNISGGGGANQIYYETGAIINNILSGGGCNVFTLCTPLMFDYSNAPGTGCTTGMNEFNIPISAFQIFPNPATDYITIQYTVTSPKETTVSLFNIYGQIVYSENLQGFKNLAGLNQLQIDMQDLEQGIYFVKINAGGKEEVRKVVKL